MYDLRLYVSKSIADYYVLLSKNIFQVRNSELYKQNCTYYKLITLRSLNRGLWNNSKRKYNIVTYC